MDSYNEFSQIRMGVVYSDLSALTVNERYDLFTLFDYIYFLMNILLLESLFS